MPLVVNFSNLIPQKIDTAIDWQISFHEQFKEVGIEYTWLVFSSHFNDVFRERSAGRFGTEFVPLTETRGLKLVLFLLNFIRRNKVDIFHIHFLKPRDGIILITLAKLLRLKTKFVYHKRSPGRMIHNRLNLKKYFNPLSIFSMLLDKVVCNSDSIRENCINRGVNKQKTLRIYNGVRISRFENLMVSSKIREEFNIAPEKRIVSIVKDARPEVGLESLIRSVPRVIEKFPDTLFLIAGGGPMTEKLKAQAASLGITDQIIFAGVRNDVPEIMNESYITLDPSPVEAFGNVVVESLACSKPVIGVNAWGPKEIIVHGECGLLVDPSDDIDFAPAVIELLSSPLKVKEMGAKGLERVKKHFTVERMIAENVKLSLSILKT
jgi:glycosyltransferase involved in cell wall biosynthesis